ncbi:MAG: outer membrane protein transport protein [Marinobacter sp.]|nr:outer membrane protein transport protein [Marinobacter sp.]
MKYSKLAATTPIQPARASSHPQSWHLTAWAGVLASQLIALPALGQGFYVDEQSVRHLGNAYTGVAAIDDDPSAVYYNPAAMTAGKRGRLAANVTAVYTGLDYDGTPEMLSNQDGGSVIPVQGDRVDVDDTAPLPTLYLTLPIKDRLTYGLGLNAPFNTGTDLGDDSQARYQSIESTINTVTLTNAFAYQVSDQLSLGFGVIAQQADAELVQALSPALVCMDGGAGTAACNAFGITIDGTHSLDGQVAMEGDELSVGYNLGLLYRFNDRQQVGVGYRSKIEHKIAGEVTAIMPVTFDRISGAAITRITTPATASLSYLHRFDRLTLVLDASWTGWSEFDQLKFTAEDPEVQAFLATQTFDWDDSFRVGAGLEYALNTAWTLRTGIALDQSPIPEERATIDLGQDDYHQFAIGFSYQPSDGLTVDAGYMLGLTEKRDLSQGDLADPNQNLALIAGEIQHTFHSLGVGLRWDF